MKDLLGLLSIIALWISAIVLVMSAVAVMIGLALVPFLLFIYLLMKVIGNG